MSTTPRNWLLRYGSALLAVGAAWLARLLLEDALAGHAPYAIFFLAIAFAARLGGVGPALLAIGFGALALARSFLPPQGSFAVHGAEYQIGMAMYLAVGLSVAFLGQAMRILRIRADTYAEEARHQQAQVAQESTGRQHAERAKAVAEERLQCVLDSVPTLISYVDARGCYQLNNRAYERWFGHSRNEIAGKHLREVLGEPAWEAIRPAVESALAGQPVSYESVVPYKSGGIRYIHADYIPQVSQEGESLGFVALVQDITERKQAEAALADNAARFRHLMETANEGIWMLDADGRITALNQRMAEMMGYGQEDMLGRFPWDFLFEEDRAAVMALFERRRAGLVEQVSIRLRHRAGHPVWTVMAGRPLLDGGERFQGTLDMFTDVSEQKRAEEALRQSEERLSLVMQATNDAIWDLDLGSSTVWRNAAYDEHFGQMPRESRDRYEWWREHVHPEDRQRVLASFEQCVARGLDRWASEYRFLRTDGTYAEVLDRGYLARDQHGRVVRALGAMLDITERKRMEAALRESEARLRLAAEGAHVGFWFWDTSIDRLEWTPMCKRLLGVPPDQEVTYPMFLGCLIPEDRGKVQAMAAQVLERGDDFAMEYRVRWPDGSIHWIYALGRLAHASDGKARALSGVAIDITERKQAEESLREAHQRKDEFLATLAHELRNPLAPVRNAVHIMRALGPKDEKLQWARDVIERQVEQMARLVDDLLDVSRITRGKIQLRKERLALADVVTSALETSRPLVESSGHTLTVSLPPEPLEVDADATRLAQVLANLLNNAAKYTEEGGHIWLAVERDDGHAVIRVRDDGVGIPRDMLPRIFDMFTQVDRSLERAQGGLGIGLTLVQKLVEMHGGTVAAHSDGPGQGSEFLVRLPLAAEHEAHVPGEVNMEALEESARSCCRVLVIDDNEDSAETLGMLLQVKGHEVHVAFSGHQALETAEAVVPDVVLLDIGLPDISGYEVARRMRQQPALKDVVLIAQTGWGQEEDRRQSQVAGFDHHLVKPIDLDALRVLLADICSSLASRRGRSGRAGRAGARDAMAGATAPAAGSTDRG